MNTKIEIPIIIVGIKDHDKVQVLLPTKAVFLLRTLKDEEITFLGDSTFEIEVQKLVDILIDHPNFFHCLDIAIDSEPYERKLNQLIKKAKNLPEQ